MAHEERSGRHIEHSISPGVPCPETVMVALMADGSYLLVGGCREMPMALVAPEDAAALRDALDAAFGNPAGKSRASGARGDPRRAGGGLRSELGGHTPLLISAMRC